MPRANDYFPLQGEEREEVLNGKPSSAPADGWAPQAVTVQVSVHPAGADRKWDLSCANCAGQCDTVGWGVCCLTTWCFPCMFGYVKYRAFGDFKKALAWGLLVTVLFYAGRVYKHAFFEDDDEDDDDFHNHHGYHGSDGLDTDSDSEIVVKPKYRDHAKTLIAVYWVVVVVCYIAISIIGAVNRMRMRKKFGVTPAGHCCECGGAHDLEDACLWTFCHLCATCQEARTLIANRVEDGAWQGPLSTVAVSEVPAPGVAMVPITHAVAPPLQDFNAPAKV